MLNSLPSLQPVELGPNGQFIGEPESRDALCTPALVLDLDALEFNIKTMAQLCEHHGISSRPHAKTHKSTIIADKQIKAGAKGVCCASLHEAEVMVAAGIPGVLITSPIVGKAKIERLARLNFDTEDLMIIVDNSRNIKDMDEAISKTGRTVGVLVDIDIGLGRTGINSVADAIKFAQRVNDSCALNFKGVQAFSGRAQHIQDYNKRRTIYLDQLNILQTIRNTLEEQGLSCDIISGGGTGSFDLDCKADIFTENQAGSYVFMDARYNTVEVFYHEHSCFNSALYIQSTVVSNNIKGAVTTDAGFKSFATEGPMPELTNSMFADARYEFFGDENGRIVFAETGQDLEIGEVIEFIVPCCDPTVNLHDYYHCVRDHKLVDIWPVDARGVL